MRHSNTVLLLLFACSFFLCPKAKAQIKDSITFAAYGNSISTYYDNYLPSGYAIFYSQDREIKHGIQVGDTWWMQLSRVSGMTFLANSSWSGSRVAFTSNNNDISPFCSNARIVSLARNGVPDIIIIAGGTNDWGHGNIPLGEYSTTVYNDSLTFRGAYALMLHKMQRRYPNTKLVCLSLFPRGDGINVQNAQGWTQAQANTSIRTIAKQFGAYFVDCSAIGFSSNWYGYTLDKLHPTTAGHKLVADCIRRSLITQGLFTSALAKAKEVDAADCLLDLHFDADGIVNEGSYNATIGKHGQPTTVYDEHNDLYYGCIKANNADFYYAAYDEGSPLAEAFNQNVTWEALVRLDGLVNGSNSCERVCFLSNEQDGGWSFFNSQYASTFSYTHKSGIKSTMKCLSGDSIMVPGKFYHMVVTMDRASHTMRYFVNGTLVCTGTRAGTDMVLPKCGTSAGKKGMWICLGGDCTSSTYRVNAEYGATCTFAFVRIYNGALTQKAAKALYTDKVRALTEPLPAVSDHLLLNCHFSPNGAQNRSFTLPHIPIEMIGNVPIQWNSQIHSYEACFSGSKTDFFKYNMGISPAAMNGLADAYSLEVYCQAESAQPRTIIKPAGFVNNFGTSLSMGSTGKIGYATTTQGYKVDGKYTKTAWSYTAEGLLTDRYTHYVVTYDRMGHLSALYIDGQQVHSRTLTNKECPIYEWLPSEWLCIGGDASGRYDATTSTGAYPFMGRVAQIRLWDKALSPSEVQGLHSATTQQELSFTTGSNGYAGVCVPFATTVPEGFTAYVVTQEDGTYAYLKQVCEQGEVLPYGTPVLIKGNKKTNFTLRAVNLDAAPTHIADVSENILQGTFIPTSMPVGSGYYVSATTISQGMTRASTVAQLPAFSVFLTSTLKRSVLTFQEDETAIFTPAQTEPKANTGLYLLNGQALPAHSNVKGIVINNGRKELR